MELKPIETQMPGKWKPEICWKQMEWKLSAAIANVY